MAQECGFFDAQLVGDSYDRVYLAAQFAAYFASFIRNGIFGHSMQQLEVSQQDVSDMSIKVLGGQAWINGYWYRNTGDYTMNLDIADGVLSRIDTIVLRWSNSDRAMYLHVIKGTPSANPTAPAIVRDADYYDLGLAQVSIPAGCIRVTQAQITDLRLNNNYCGLVTGLVDQIDLTDLWNQFEQYFYEFKEKYQKEFDNWTDEQEQALNNYIVETKAAYSKFVTDMSNDYTTWTNEKKDEWSQWVTDQMLEFTTWVDNEKIVYNTWTTQQRQAYMDWYTLHTTAWEAMIEQWFEDIKGKLSGDPAVSLQLQIDELVAKQPTEHYADIKHDRDVYVTLDMFLTTYACGTQGAGIGPAGGAALVSTPVEYTMEDRNNVSIKGIPNIGVVDGVSQLSEDMYAVLFQNNIKSLVVVLHGNKVVSEPVEENTNNESEV